MQDACGPSLLKVKKRKSFPANPDDMETQVDGAPNDGAGRRIPRIQAPDCLPDVIACLEAHDRYPFDHSLQYKKPFRKLHGELKKGTGLHKVVGEQTVSSMPAVVCRNSCRPAEVASPLRGGHAGILRSMHE